MLYPSVSFGEILRKFQVWRTKRVTCGGVKTTSPLREQWLHSTNGTASVSLVWSVITASVVEYEDHREDPDEDISADAKEVHKGEVNEEVVASDTPNIRPWNSSYSPWGGKFDGISIYSRTLWLKMFYSNLGLAV